MALGGVTNTTAQGNPVPLLYGKRRIGGAIISTGVHIEDKQLIIFILGAFCG